MRHIENNVYVNSFFSDQQFPEQKTTLFREICFVASGKKLDIYLKSNGEFAINNFHKNGEMLLK